MSYLVVGPGGSWASQLTDSSSLSPPGRLSSTAQANLPNVADSKEQAQFSRSHMLGSSLPALMPLESTILFCTREVKGLLSLYLVRGRTSFSVLKLRDMLSCLSKVERGEGERIFPLPLPCRGTPDSSAFMSTDLAQLFPPPTGTALVCCPGEVPYLLSGVLQLVRGRGSSPTSLGQFCHLPVSRDEGKGGGLFLTHATTWLMGASSVLLLCSFLCPH